MQRSELMMGLLIGAMAGAATALLLAPAKGKDARRKIMDTATNAGDMASGVVDAARRKAANTIQRVADTAQDLADTVAGKAEDLKEMIHAGADEAKPSPVHVRRGDPSSAARAGLAS